MKGKERKGRETLRMESTSSLTEFLVGYFASFQGKRLRYSAMGTETGKKKRTWEISLCLSPFLKEWLSSTSVCGQTLLQCDWVPIKEDSQVAAQLGHSSLSKQILLSKLIRDLHQRIQRAHLRTATQHMTIHTQRRIQRGIQTHRQTDRHRCNRLV